MLRVSVTVVSHFRGMGKGMGCAHEQSQVGLGSSRLHLWMLTAAIPIYGIHVATA